MIYKAVIALAFLTSPTPLITIQCTYADTNYGPLTDCYKRLVCIR